MDLRSVDLNLLVVFDRLMQTRSVTAAARLLGLTQSSVSAALNRLRAATKDRLLERQGNAMVPTRTAVSVWPEIRAAITAIETSLARLGAFEPSRHTATIRVGIDEYTLVILGDTLCRSLRASAPNAAIEIIPIRVPGSEEALNDGSIDIAVGAAWTPLPGLRVERLFAEQFTCLVDVDHPTVGGSPSLEAYLSIPHILVSSIGQVPGNVDAALTRRGRQRRIGVTVPYLLAAPQLLAGSDMIFNTGRRLAERLAAWYPVKLVAPPIRIPGFSISMIWHPRNADSPAHRWLRGQTLAAARSLAA